MSTFRRGQNSSNPNKLNVILSTLIFVLILNVSIQIWLLYAALNNALDNNKEILIPAFIISELKTAFQIGFIIFIPFLVIDIVVSSVLMAMGMMMLSPLIISLPFKIMLFVLVDGWAMIVGTLAASYGV